MQLHATVFDAQPAISGFGDSVQAGQTVSITASCNCPDPDDGEYAAAPPDVEVSGPGGDQGWVYFDFFTATDVYLEASPPPDTQPGTYYATVDFCDGFLPFDPVTQCEVDAGPINVEEPAAPPPPILSVTANGSAVAPGGMVWITPPPALPTLAAILLPDAGYTLTGTVSWQIVFDYSAGAYDWECSVPAQPITLPVSAQFNITTTMSGICGGTATITYTYNSSPPQSFTFNVLGQSPSATTIKNYLGTDPWFLQQLVNHESGYLQFLSSGQPNFGPPNGFGVMQAGSTLKHLSDLGLDSKHFGRHFRT